MSVGAPVSVPLMKAVHAHEGNFVRKGDLLFEVDDQAYREVVKQRVAAYERAQVEVALVKEEVKYNQKIREMDLTAARADLKLHSEDLIDRTKELDIYSKLYKQQGATVMEYYEARFKFYQAQFDKNEAERRTEKATDALSVGLLRDKEMVAKAFADLELARIDLQVARLDAERTRILSPMDGFVEYAGQPEPVAGTVIEVNQVLAQVLNLDPVFVQMDFPQERIDDVAIGQKAEVVLDSFPKETFTGRVVRIWPQANTHLRVLPVMVQLSNPRHRIKAGVSGFVRLRLTRKAATVPATAVIERGSKAMVFRVEHGRARICEIETGRPLGRGMVELRDGLKLGDEVVIYNPFHIQDNDRVDANWRRWAHRE